MLRRISIAVPIIFMIGTQLQMLAQAQGRATNLGTGQVMTCPAGEELDPYQVWRDVHSREDARRFLMEQYNELGDVSAFVGWMVCQDFFVSVADGRNTIGVNEGEKGIGATFQVSEKIAILCGQ